MPRSRRRFLRGLATSLAAALLCLVLGEAGARIWLHVFASEEAFERYATYAEALARNGDEGAFFVRHRYIGFAGRPGFVSGLNRHNAHGFRGAEIPLEKPPGEYRIACVGGSTTYTNGVEDWRRSYPAVLERELADLGHPEVRVINAGLHGWSSWETLVNFEFKLLDLEPDLVVVYHAINDLKLRMVWPPDTYRGDNGGAATFAPGLVVTPLWQDSALARIAAIRCGALLPQGELEARLDVKTAASRWRPFRSQLLYGTYPRGLFAKVGAEEILAACPPVYFERNLASLIAIADSHGIDVLLATFAFRREGLGGDNPGTDIAVAGVAEMNAVLRALADRTPADLYDFAAEMPLDERYFGDDVHLTEAGAALKARLFAHAIAPRLPGRPTR